MIAWHTITNPKYIGGLGVLDLKTFNQALLAKWGWTWYSNQESIWKELNLTLQSQQFSLMPLKSSLTAPLEGIKPILQTTIKRSLFSGQTTSFWHQDWDHGILSIKFPLAYSYCLIPHATVAQTIQVINSTQPIFNSQILHTSEPLQQQQTVLSLIHGVTLTSGEDTCHWRMGTVDSSFSVSKFYNFIKVVPKLASNLRHIWKLNIPPRMVFFMWQMLQNRIATLDNLKRRGFQLANFCVLCKKAEESVLHLFDDCCFTRNLNQLINNNLHLDLTGQFRKIYPHRNFSVANSTALQCLSLSCFLIWRERCGRTFSELKNNPSQIFQQFNQEMLLGKILV